MALAAKDRTPDFWLERDLVMLSAMIANDLEFLGRIHAGCGLFRATFSATLGRRHVALVEHFLFFFREEKRLFALNANGLNVRHLGFSFL
jgi:hypothetical protein